MRVNERVAALRESIGAPHFTDPWDLNLVVVRSGRVGLWDDRVIVTCVDDDGDPVRLVCRATGDAWDGEWGNPSHPDGCIYVLDQHVPAGLIVGEHKGRPALRQNRPFLNVRWPPGMGRIPTVDELEARGRAGFAFSESRGTHIHNRASHRTPAKPAPNDSEGCTVLLYQHEHAALMALVEQQRLVRGSAVVSPTYTSRKVWQGLQAA